MSIDEQISKKMKMQTAANLADVMDKITSDSELNPTHKRDWLSAIRRVSQILNSTPEGLPASPHQLAAKLEGIHPIKQGISTKTWQNIKSNLLAAVRYHQTHSPKQKRLPLTPEWQRLYESLPGDRMKFGLSRLIRFCSLMGLPPESVSDATIELFLKALKDDTLLSEKQRRECHVRSTRLWNEAIDCVPGWPHNHLKLASYRKPRTTHPLSAFPKCFQDEIAVYLKWLGEPDPLDNEARSNPLSKNTLILRERQLQLSASALVSQGKPIAEITCLARLVELETTKQILRFYLNKKGKPSSFSQGLAITLVSLAKEWVKVDEQLLSELKKVRARMGGLEGGMTEKNRNMLRQFELVENLRRFLCLPEKLIQSAKQQSGRKAALTYQLALTIELLLNAPIRMENLINLEFDRHLIKTGGPGDPCHLVLAAHETKNGQPLEFCLSDRLSTMLDEYQKHYLKLLSHHPDRYLYPGQNGGHKSPSTLSQALENIISKHTGIKITPHQFRHLAGMLYLDANPGHYEVVRQLLGHKNLKTTVQFYASLNSRQAQRLHDRVIATTRERLALGQNAR